MFYKIVYLIKNAILGGIKLQKKPIRSDLRALKPFPNDFLGQNEVG